VLGIYQQTNRKKKPPHIHRAYILVEGNEIEICTMLDEGNRKYPNSDG
jgi:hypothetical protein